MSELMILIQNSEGNVFILSALALFPDNTGTFQVMDFLVGMLRSFL